MSLKLSVTHGDTSERHFSTILGDGERASEAVGVEDGGEVENLNVL